MSARRITAEDLRFDGQSFEELDGVKLHAICLLHMSQFVANPTPTGAAVVAALLEALSRHEMRYQPECGCDLYAQARALWRRVVSAMEDGGSAEGAPSPSVVH
jgi:hypothetical protein